MNQSLRQNATRKDTGLTPICRYWLLSLLQYFMKLQITMSVTISHTDMQY